MTKSLKSVDLNWKLTFQVFVTKKNELLKQEGKNFLFLISPGGGGLWDIKFVGEDYYIKWEKASQVKGSGKPLLILTES